MFFLHVFLHVSWPFYWKSRLLFIRAVYLPSSVTLPFTGQLKNLIWFFLSSDSQSVKTLKKILPSYFKEDNLICLFFQRALRQLNTIKNYPNLMLFSGPKDSMFTIKHYFREGLITLSIEYFKVKGDQLNMAVFFCKNWPVQCRLLYTFTLVKSFFTRKTRLCLAGHPLDELQGPSSFVSCLHAAANNFHRSDPLYKKYS